MNYQLMAKMDLASEVVSGAVAGGSESLSGVLQFSVNIPNQPPVFVLGGNASFFPSAMSGVTLATTPMGDSLGMYWVQSLHNSLSAGVHVCYFDVFTLIFSSITIGLKEVAI